MMMVWNLTSWFILVISKYDKLEVVLSLVKASNYTENAGHAEVCLTFSLQFVSLFTIRLSTVVTPNITIPHRGKLCDRVYSGTSTADTSRTARMF